MIDSAESWVRHQRTAFDSITGPRWIIGEPSRHQSHSWGWCSRWHVQLALLSCISMYFLIRPCSCFCLESFCLLWTFRTLGDMLMVRSHKDSFPFSFVSLTSRQSSCIKEQRRHVISISLALPRFSEQGLLSSNALYAAGWPGSRW